MRGGFSKRRKVNAVLARTFVWFASLICCLLLIKTKLAKLCGRNKVRAVVWASKLQRNEAPRDGRLYNIALNLPSRLPSPRSHTHTHTHTHMHTHKYILVNIYIYICVCMCACVCEPDSSVGIATYYVLDGPGSNPGGDEIFSPSRPDLRPKQPPVKWVSGVSRGSSAAGACCWPLTPFYCPGHGRVELYLYPPSRPHRPVIGITLPFSFLGCRTVVGCCERGNEPSEFSKMREFLKNLRRY